jgi:predicted MFS family arabinose efflux permease
VLLAVSLGSLWLLLRQERRAATPLIPVALLRHPAIWRADLLAVSVGACIVASVTFVPVYLQVVRGVQPGEVGLLMLPQTAGIALGSMFTGRLIARTGRTAVMPTVGLVISTATLVLIAALAGSVPIRGLPWMFLVLSFTLGTAMPVVQMTTQIAAGPKNLGAIAASVQFSRSIGAALGTAIVGAILFATLAAQNPETAGMFVRVVEIGGHAMDVLTPARRVVMQQEFATAFRAAFLAIAVFAAGGWVLAATLPVRRL